MRAVIFWKFLLCALLLGQGLGGCGDDPAMPTADQADASSATNTRDAGDVGVETPDAGSLTPPAACGCDSDHCGGAGLCLCSAGQAVCICDAGHTGTGCQSCEPGFQNVAGQCRIKLESVRQEVNGSNCEAGGVAIEAGVDTDGNGALDSNEIQNTQYVCNAAAPPASSNGSDAGTHDAGNGSGCSGIACCTAGSCGFGGACVDAVGSAQCICSTGYSGPRCETCAPGYESDNGTGGDGICKRTAMPAARVLTGDVTVTNQAELDTLRDVTEIRGSLTISARYVQTLEPLQHLSILTGSLVINSCPSLTNFGGLNRLTRIDGDLIIHGNSRLSTVETLSELVSIGGSLEIRDNPELQSVSGLRALAQVAGALTISSNPRLGSIEALSALATIGGTIEISHDDALQSISSLGALTRIDGDLILTDNGTLTDIGGLSSLKVVLGALSIERLPKLVTLAGLEALHSVGNMLTLDENSTLGHVDSLSNLVDTGGLTISNAPQLDNVDGLSALRSVRGDFIIRDNASLLHLYDFPILEAVEGLFVIAGNPQLLALDGFDKLAETGPFYIFNNAAMLTIGGFNALSTITPWCQPIFRVSDPFGYEHGVFAHIHAVESLPFVELESRTQWPDYLGYRLQSSPSDVIPGWVYNQPPLITEVCGLARTEIRIRENPALTEISAFTSLSRGVAPAPTVEFYANHTLTTITTFDKAFDAQYVRVAENPKLSNVSIGLNSVAEELRLVNNDAWVSLQGISVSQVNELFIVGNDRLTDATLPNLTTATLVTVRDNARLPSLQSLLGGAQEDGLDGNAVFITGNPLLTDLGDMPFGTLDQFHVANNAALTGLSGFPSSLTNIGWLKLEGNANLEALTNIKPKISTLTIRDNAKLPTCLAEAYKYLEPVTSSATISGNAGSATCAP